jgi:hypothetical protein
LRNSQRGGTTKVVSLVIFMKNSAPQLTRYWPFFPPCDGQWP